MAVPFWWLPARRGSWTSYENFWKLALTPMLWTMYGGMTYADLTLTFFGLVYMKSETEWGPEHLCRIDTQGRYFECWLTPLCVDSSLEHARKIFYGLWAVGSESLFLCEKRWLNTRASVCICLDRELKMAFAENPVIKLLTLFVKLSLVIIYPGLIHSYNKHCYFTYEEELEK